VIATYSNKTIAEIKDAITWKSNNTNVAKVSSSGVVTFTGKPGKVTISATYKGKSTSVSTTVGNVVKSLITSTKLAYNKKPVTVALTAIYADGKSKPLNPVSSGNLVISKYQRSVPRVSLPLRDRTEMWSSLQRTKEKP
jgi:hypothetical protein